MTYDIDGMKMFSKTDLVELFDQAVAKGIDIDALPDSITILEIEELVNRT